MVIQRPELHIITMKNEEVCSDTLSIRNFEQCPAISYHLEYLPEDNHFYIVTPKDIVVAKVGFSGLLFPIDYVQHRGEGG